MAASGSAQVKRGYYLDHISAFDLWHLFASATEHGREQWWQPKGSRRRAAGGFSGSRGLQPTPPNYRELS